VRVPHPHPNPRCVKPTNTRHSHTPTLISPTAPSAMVSWCSARRTVGCASHRHVAHRTARPRGCRSSCRRCTSGWTPARLMTESSLMARGIGCHVNHRPWAWRVRHKHSELRLPSVVQEQHTFCSEGVLLVNKRTPQY
jgi:hypothetical protein